MRSLKRNPFLFGIIVGAMVLGLTAWKFAMPTAAESPRLERYLPAETIGFVEVNNLRAQALQVLDSEAWRAFTKDNQAASALVMMGANHTGVLDASYALALVGVSGEGAASARQPQFVLIAEFTSTEARHTFENRALHLLHEAKEKNLTPQTENYNDVEIHTLASTHGHAAAYAQVGNMLLVSNSNEGIKKILDVKAGKAKTLEGNARFIEARAQAPYSGGLFGFLDVASLTRVIDSVPAQEKEGVAAFRQLFHGVGADSVQSITLTSSFVDGRVTERIVVSAPDKGAGLLHALASNPPTPQALLALVPENASQVFDASIANAPQSFDELSAVVNQIAEQKGKKTVADALQELTEKTSVDLRGEIIGAFGAEACLMQLPEDGKRVGAIILNLKDQERFARALEKVAKFKEQTISAREYKGVQITHAAKNDHDHFYAFLGGNFVASESGAAIERIIDTSQGAASLASSAAYRTASANATGSPLFVYYNSNTDYLKHLGGMLAGGGQGSQAAGQPTAGVRPSFAFGISRGDGFLIESRSPLGTFPRLLTMVTAKMASHKDAAASE